MRRCIRGRDTLRYFLLWPSSLPLVVAQPNKRLPNRTPKSTLRWCHLTDAECGLRLLGARRLGTTRGLWVETMRRDFYAPELKNLKRFFFPKKKKSRFMRVLVYTNEQTRLCFG